jgi:pSer/pThr/pTyr-binding forkhead associated (FHA) protein
LEVASGRNTGLKIPVKDRRFLIGRAEDCDLRAHSEQVSRYHCAILIEDHGVFVRDYGSRNGTFVDKTRVTGQRRLTDGAEIRVGPLVFVARLGEKRDPPAGETVEGRQLETVADSPQGRVGQSSGAPQPVDNAGPEPFDVLALLNQPPDTPATSAPNAMPTETEPVPAASPPKPPSKITPKVEPDDAAEAWLKQMFSAQPKKKRGG